MAVVHQCDRCGEIFKGQPVQCTQFIHIYFEHTRIDSDTIRTKVDLCAKCVEEFNHWYNRY